MRFGQISLRNVRFDQCPLRALPQWLYTDRKQGRVDSFTEATPAGQAYAARLQSMQEALSYPFALHQRPVVIPPGQ